MSDVAEVARGVGAPIGEKRLVYGWGRAVSSEAEVVRALGVEDVRATFRRAAESGRSVCLRGAGCSYGDAALNGGGIVLDLSAMNRILDLDRATGVATIEPGVTIRDLWTRALPAGYWPPVV